MVVKVALLALEDLEIGPYLPVDFSPRYPISLSDESDELFEIPRPVNHMLGSNLTVIVDISFSFRAVEYLALAHREELVAECTLVKVVPLFLEQQLQLLHEQPTDQFVLPFFKDVEPVKRYLSGHFSDNLRIYAAHVNLHF